MQGQSQNNNINVNNKQITQIKSIAKQAIVVNKSNFINGSVISIKNSGVINNNSNNNNSSKVTNSVNKRADVVDLTGDDERTSNATTTSKTLNKIVSPVTAGTRIMLMPFVTTNMKSPMVLKLNAGIK